jgi:hypothetical protein
MFGGNKSNQAQRSGYKSGFGLRDTNSSFLKGLESTQDYVENRDKWARHYGAKDYDDANRSGGSTVFVPMYRYVEDGVSHKREFKNGDPGVVDGKIPINWGGKMINVDVNRGINVFDPSYFGEKVKKAQEESAYITKLTNLMLVAGDNEFFTLMPECYVKCKTAGCTPSKISVLPETSIEYSNKLWELRTWIAKFKDTLVFDGEMPHVGMHSITTTAHATIGNEV